MSNYSCRKERLWYGTRPLKTGVVVTCDVTDPDLVERGTFTFIEHKEGTYYLDFTFDKNGSWLWIFYEGGIKKDSRVFRVGTFGFGLVRYIK